MVVVDNQKNAEQLNEAAKLKNLILNVLIDVDGGQVLIQFFLFLNEYIRGELELNLKKLFL